MEKAGGCIPACPGHANGNDVPGSMTHVPCSAPAQDMPLGSTTPRGVCSKEGAGARPATGFILPCPIVCTQFRQEPASFQDRLPHRQTAEASGKGHRRRHRQVHRPLVCHGCFMVFGPAAAQREALFQTWRQDLPWALPPPVFFLSAALPAG